jgi:hypothetical protein
MERAGFSSAYSIKKPSSNVQPLQPISVRQYRPQACEVRSLLMQLAPRPLSSKADIRLHVADQKVHNENIRLIAEDAANSF